MRISTLKHLFIGAALIVGLATPAAAQQPTQPVTGGNEQTMLFGAGLTFMNAGDATGVGLAANALFNALTSSNRGNLGIAGDFGFNNFDGGTIVTVMGGPRYTFKTSGKVAPYGQFLVGIVRNPVDTDFRPALGFGADIAWKPNLNFRGEISFFLDDTDATRFFFGVSLPINK